MEAKFTAMWDLFVNLYRIDPYNVFINVYKERTTYDDMESNFLDIISIELCVIFL